VQKFSVSEVGKEASRKLETRLPFRRAIEVGEAYAGRVKQRDEDEDEHDEEHDDLDELDEMDEPEFDEQDEDEELQDDEDGEDDEDDEDEDEDEDDGLEAAQADDLEQQIALIHKSTETQSDGTVQSELEKARNVKNQRTLWDHLLDSRIKMQPVLQLANRLPEHLLVRAAQSEPQCEAAFTELHSELDSLLSGFVELQCELAQRNSETESLQVKRARSDEYEASERSVEGWWELLDSNFQAMEPFYRTAIEKWNMRTQLSTGSNLHKKFKAVNKVRFEFHVLNSRFCFSTDRVCAERAAANRRRDGRPRCGDQANATAARRASAARRTRCASARIRRGNIR
jgi:hypothetical protein